MQFAATINAFAAFAAVARGTWHVAATVDTVKTVGLATKLH